MWEQILSKIPRFRAALYALSLPRLKSPRVEYFNASAASFSSVHFLGVAMSVPHDRRRLVPPDNPG
jgi:hypothetical protein